MAMTSDKKIAIYEKIYEICRKKGKTIADLERELGMTRSTIIKIKTSEPTLGKLISIADALEVDVTEIIGESKPPEKSVVFTHVELIDLFDKLAPNEQAAVITIMQSMQHN